MAALCIPLSSSSGPPVEFRRARRISDSTISEMKTTKRFSFASRETSNFFSTGSKESPKANRILERMKRTTSACDRLSLIVSTKFLVNTTLRNKELIEETYNPKSFDAGICGGYCYYNLIQTGHAHSIMVSLFIRFYGVNSVVVPQCCLPVEYGPLQIVANLRYANNTIETKKEVVIPDMIVTRCECIHIVNIP